MAWCFPDNLWVGLGLIMDILHHIIHLLHLHAVLHIIHQAWMHFPNIFHGVWVGLPSSLSMIWKWATSIQTITTTRDLLGLIMAAVGLFVSLGVFEAGRKILLVLGLFFAVTATVDWANSPSNFHYQVLGFGYTIVLLAALHIFIVEGDISYEIRLVFRALEIIGRDGGLSQYTSNRLEQRQRRRRRMKYEQRTVVAQSLEEAEEQAARFKRLVDRCEKARILAYPLDEVGEPEREEGEPRPEEGSRATNETIAEPNTLQEADYLPEDTAMNTFRDSDLNMRSARYLLQWLAREIHESEGFVVPVKWSQHKKTGKIDCYNGYNHMNRPVEKDFFANSDDLIIGSVSVTSPVEIQPAMLLINTALDYIKFYDSSKFENEGQEALKSHTQFRRAVAVKCEFKRYPAEYRHDSQQRFDVDNPNWVDDQEHGEEAGRLKEERVKNGNGGSKGVYVQRDRELVTLLTVSVDRYLVVTFHLGHMLQYPTAQTCREVQILFEDLILNKKVIKIWYNVPDSIAALDATLEHIFRGRPPPPNKGAPNYQDALKQYKNSARKPFRETEGSPLRLPHYKDTGPETYLDVNRPASLEFERGEKPCPLGFHGPGVDYAGRRCPCYLGIFDITSILDFILRQHHFIPGDPTSNPQEMKDNETIWPALGSWAEPRKDCDFVRLAQWMLAGSKYQPLLCRFKTRSHTIPKRPHTTGIEGIGAKEAMNIYNMQVAIYKEKYAQLYTVFGETNGIERDEVCLSYIVGDAIGLGLMFRYLLTTESPRLIGERLSHYGYREPLIAEPFAYETALYRPPLEPLRLLPLEQPLSHTIGLEVDVRPQEDEIEYMTDTIYAKLANRPWWYMRRDTHWTALENYGRVMGVAFQRTGWEFPVPLESEQREISEEGNYNQPIGCRNLAARIFRNNSIYSPPGLVPLFRRAAYFSNAAWFSAFVCLLEWHCGLIDLNLPPEDLAVIYHNEAPMPAEVAFRRDFAAHVRATGIRTFPSPRRVRNIPGAQPARQTQPVTPRRIRAPTGQTPTPSPQQDPTPWWWGRIFRQEPVITQPPPTLWQSLWNFGRRTPEQVPPAPPMDGPPEGYVVRTSKRTGRLFWWNRERNESMWPDRPAALAAERRAADARTAAEEAVMSTNRDVANANAALTAAQTSAREAAITATNVRQAGTDAARQAANDGAFAAKQALLAAREQAADANAAGRTAHVESAFTTAALRAGNAVAAEAAAQRAVDAAAIARTASAAAVQYANDAAIGNQRALGATAPAAAVTVAVNAVVAARQRAAAVQRQAEFLQQQATEIAVAQQAVENLVNTQMDVRVPSIIPVPQNFTPPWMGGGLVSWAATRWAADASRRALETERAAMGAVGELTIAEAAARQTADAAALALATLAQQEDQNGALAAATLARNDLATAQQALDTATADQLAAITAARAAAQRAFTTTRLTRGLHRDIDTAINTLSTANNQPDYTTDDDRTAIAVLAIASTTARKVNRILAASRQATRRTQDAVAAAQQAANDVAAAQLAIDAAVNEQQAAETAAAAAATAIAIGPEWELHPDSTSIIIPIPEQHNFMDGVCAEILIFMLVQEISQYEALDSDRRMFLGFGKMEKEYRAFAKSSLWDHAAVKLMTIEAGLDGGSYNHLSYKEPYWFKRLQVLLGHDFVCCTPLNSTATTICQQCGANDRYELLEMLIAELERVKKLAETQVKLRDAYSRIYHETRRRMWMWGQFKKPRVPKPISINPTQPAGNNRNEVDPATGTVSMWARLSSLWGLSGTSPAAPPVAVPRTQHENEWAMPPWCKCLLKNPLNEDQQYPKPSVRRLHRDWLQATIVLLHDNPEIGPDTWDCLRKWWNMGLRVQATCFYDENVHQFDLPSLTLITEDDPEPLANFGVNQAAVDARRKYNPEMRLRATEATIVDNTIARRVAQTRRNTQAT